MIKIPKKIHIIWVGDEYKRPDQWIKTWYDNHPDWEIKIWGNEELLSFPWKCKNQIDSYRQAKMWEGVADIMRYEILHIYGGVYVDADSISVRPLDDWLLDSKLFAVYESEKYVPGIIANGFIGCVPGHPILSRIIQKISKVKIRFRRFSWRKFKYKKVGAAKMVGPFFFTKIIHQFPWSEFTVLPSILFLPKHFRDQEERLSSLIYARHEWGTTKHLYETAASDE